MPRRLPLACAAALLLIGLQWLLPPNIHLVPTAEAASAPITVNVRDFGAKGDGEHDDSDAVRRAIKAAAARPGSTVFFPAGTYRCASAIGLSNCVNLRGKSRRVSWLQGRLEFGSRSRVSRLRIGAVGSSAITNRRGAVGTTFTACRFRGGGSTEGVNGSVVYLGGGQGDVSDIRFIRCSFERTSYEPPAGVDAFARNVGNTITIHEFTYRRDGAHVEDIIFRDCHLGASNGSEKGALRMMMEAYCWDNRTGLAYHGWKNLTFDGCTIEAADTTGLDFADDRLLTGSDPPRHASSGVLITDCTFLGARKDETYGHGGLPIVYECPTGIVIKSNTFFASPQEAIGGSKVRESTNAPAMLIKGNVFDMTRSPVGLRHQTGEPIISLVGHNSRVVGNTFRYNSGWGVLIKSGGGSLATVGNVVRGNTFIDTRSNGGEPTIHFADDHDRGCYGNRIVGNTIRNRAAGRRGVVYQSTSMGTNYARDNVIVCGDSAPFLVRSGRIVRSGNRIN